MLLRSTKFAVSKLPYLGPWMITNLRFLNSSIVG